MSLTVARPLPAILTFVIILAWVAPAYAREHRPPRGPRPTAPATTAQRIGLYAPRVRRSTVMYLRLRLLELREAGLDRARAAIERRLSIDDLLVEPAAPHQSDVRDRARPMPPASEKTPQPPY